MKTRRRDDNEMKGRLDLLHFDETYDDFTAGAYLLGGKGGKLWAIQGSTPVLQGSCREATELKGC